MELSKNSGEVTNKIENTSSKNNLEERQEMAQKLGAKDYQKESNISSNGKKTTMDLSDIKSLAEKNPVPSKLKEIVDTYPPSKGERLANKDYQKPQEKELKQPKMPDISSKDIVALNKNNVAQSKLKEIVNTEYPIVKETPRNKFQTFKDNVNSNEHINRIKEHLSDNSTKHPVPVIESYKDIEDGKANHGGGIKIGLESSDMVEVDGKMQGTRDKATLDIHLKSSADDKTVKADLAISANISHENVGNKLSEKYEAGVNLMHSYGEIKTDKENGSFSARGGFNMADGYARKSVTDETGHTNTIENKTEMYGFSGHVMHDQYENKAGYDYYKAKNTSSTSFDGVKTSSNTIYDSGATKESASDNPYSKAFTPLRAAEAYEKVEEEKSKKQ